MNLAPGTHVDRYQVEDELGRGGMARVYRVRHTTLDTVHALKVLTLSGEEIRHRLLREGRVQAQLDHPNIVPVRDVLMLPEGPGLLMDYIDGKSLDAWLPEHRPDLAERERIFRAITAGVAFAHDRGVVHRDLKPGNVMMQRRDDQWVPRVADFGLAKLIANDDADGPLQSRTGRPMGTPAYMAPEQVRSAKHVDARADIFALGCILYELFCQRRAFAGSDSLEVFNRITQGHWVRPRDVNPDIAPRIENAIYGALAVRPEDRIGDCETLLAVLDERHEWVPPSPTAETFFAESPDVVQAQPDAPVDVARTVAAEATHLPTLAPPDSTLAPATPEPTLPSTSPPPQRAVPIAPIVAAVAVMALLVTLVQLWRSSEPASPDVASPPAQPTVSEPAVVEPSPAPVEPAPAQLEPEPAPVVAPAPVAPTPPAPASRMGRVDVRGDARSVRLRGSGGTRAEPGEVQPGTYVIEAAFGDGPPMHAGNLEVRMGETLQLTCRADTQMCTP